MDRKMERDKSPALGHEEIVYIQLLLSTQRQCLSACYNGQKTKNISMVKLIF
jgi:G:T/U-mismatch repair DNA glycosylase